MDRAEALAYVVEHIDQYALHYPGHEAIGSKIPAGETLMPGMKCSFAIMPMLMGVPGPHGTAVIETDKLGALIVNAPGFKCRRLIRPCAETGYWRTWVVELDGKLPDVMVVPVDIFIREDVDKGSRVHTPNVKLL